MWLLLPLTFINFWFIEGLVFFGRVWKNTMLFLEEDLAVGLMLRLLFVPLYHDNSLFGRILSLIFRVSRIFFGLVAYVFATLLIILLAIIWFTSPIFLFLSFLVSSFGIIFLISVVTLLFGITIFLGEIMHKPLQRLWHIKKPQDIWKSTKLKPGDISWEKLVKTPEVLSFITSLELTPEQIPPQNVPLNDAFYAQVFDLAKKAEAPFITAIHFWVTMVCEVPGIERELMKYNLRKDDFIDALVFYEYKRNKWKKYYLWDEDFRIHHLKGVNRGWLGAPTPALDAVATDLTKMAASVGFPDFIGRANVVNEVITILSQSADRNVLLVGPAGTGKTTLVQSLASRIVAGDAPPALATKRLVQLDLTKLLSAVETEGDLASKIKAAFEEVKYIQDIIIFVDEIQNMGLGEAGSKLNLYSLLLPYLESNQFQFLSTTDQGNYARIIEKNGSFARLFHKVEIPPASVPDTIKALQEEAVKLARYKKIDLTFIAIKDLAIYSNKLIHDRVLPDSALGVLREAEVMAIKGQITSSIVKQTIEKRVNVPLVEIDQNHRDMLLKLETIIHERMIDQEEAVQAVADTLRRSATALREENRPIGSFLFVGPTGVGKTELARILAEVYFKTAGAFLRFDMSEYQTAESVNRLLGTESNPGELTEAIKTKPYALLLLDEFEKANPQILTLFLQVLEEGRLTDYSGTHIDFSNTIIIATSNAGSLSIAKGLEEGKTVGQLEPEVQGELLKIYKPELVNRFDKIVIFKPLSTKDLAQIVTLKLQSLGKTLEAQGYVVEFSPKLVVGLAQKGYNPVLGARPLRRLIQDTLEARLSRLILENKLVKGELFVADDDLLA